MGKEIRIQKWDGRKLWDDFQKKHPEVTDENCRMILFNITVKFSSLLRAFLSNNDLRSVLQYILGDGLWDVRYTTLGVDFPIRVLYAVVNSDKSKTIAVTEENKGMIEDGINEYSLNDDEIRYCLRGMSIQMPQCREDLNKVGLFLRERIEEKIDTIDRFMNMDDDEIEIQEDAAETEVRRYLDTQATIKRMASPSKGQENRDPYPNRKSVRFSADIK